jgi:imidazolonepropionase-like amidohydrolase
MDDRAAQEMATHGTFLVPTLAYLHSATRVSESDVSPNTQERSAIVLQRSESAITMALSSGVGIGLGSDLVGDTLDEMGAQLRYLADVIGPLQALSSLTSTNAAVCRVQDQLGTIEVGKLADMVLIEGDILSEPALLGDPDNVVLVVKNGTIVKDLTQAK